MLLAITFSGLWVTAEVFSKDSDHTGKAPERKVATSEPFRQLSKAS